LPKTEGKTKHLLREIELMRHLKHENIVRLIDVKYEKFGHTGLRLYIIMEYCAKGDMTSLPKPLGEEKCREYFKGIFSGLRYLKKRQIIHRDVKPQNILLTEDDEVKIADFTFSKQIEENELMQTQCGTPIFISPDILFGQSYTDKSDLYSCGVMLYTFIYGTHPLGNVKTHAELVHKIKTAKVTFPQKLVMETYEKQEFGPSILCRTIHVFSQEVLALMKGLLKFNAADRFSWERVYDDPWLNLEPFDNEELFSGSPLFSQTDQNPFGDRATSPEKGPTHAFSAPSQLTSTTIVPRSVKSISNRSIKKTSVTSNNIKPQSTRPIKMPEEKPVVAIPPIAESPSPANSFEQWAFELSNEAKKVQNSSSVKESRIIYDYYGSSSTPPGVESISEPKEKGEKREMENDEMKKLMENAEMKKLMEKEKQIIEKSAKQKGKKEEVSLLSRSIDAIHRVFSI